MARRRNRSSPASSLINARRSTCLCRKTLTVVETKVANAIDITGTTTPMIVGRNRLSVNTIPSAELTTPNEDKNTDNPILIFPHNRKAKTAGRKAAMRK
mmetsp:Transcript_30454/g.45756  ORF Transcript_30454/g.45756 Transcript_30454/m.45756 type:complete len:99 (-) Transcript_30454:78-374(-)